MSARGVVSGVVATMLVLALTRRTARGGQPVATVRPSCPVSIVLFEPVSLRGRALDEATGGQGFCHVVIDGCEDDPHGRPLLIDCHPGLGVGRVLASKYDGRPRARVLLPAAEGRELYGCARAHVGLPYDALGLVVPADGPTHGVICSQFVYECLPLSLRELVPPWPATRAIAPNDLARAFGAKPGHDVTL